MLQFTMMHCRKNLPLLLLFSLLCSVVPLVDSQSCVKDGDTPTSCAEFFENTRIECTPCDIVELNACVGAADQCREFCAFMTGCACEEDVRPCLYGFEKNVYSCGGTPTPCSDITVKNECTKNLVCKWAGGGDQNDDSDPGCFSGFATVKVQGKGSTRMDKLEIGDMVLTGKGFQPIYAFAHYDKTEIAEFLEIHTNQTTTPFVVTAEHLVFVHGNPNPTRADSISVGDVLQGHGKNRVVAKIGTVMSKGLYAPLTPDGTLVVDGVKASTYVALPLSSDLGLTVMSQHAFLHMALSPFRMLCTRVAAGICQPYNETNAMPHYVAFAIQLANWVDGLHLLAQMVLLFAFFVVTGTFMAFELLVGATWVPVLLAVAAGCVGVGKVLGVAVSARKSKTA